MIAQEIARRYGEEGIVCVSVDPGAWAAGRQLANFVHLSPVLGAGVFKSDLQRHLGGFTRRLAVSG